MTPDIYLSSRTGVFSHAEKVMNRIMNGAIRRACTFALVFLFSIAATTARGQLTAGFSIDDTAGCAPLLVNFTNTSTGATNYTWDLGNGHTSFLTDASGSYLLAGTYTVTLVAHNGPASSSFSSVIRVYGPPTVNFTGSDTAICPYGSVTFNSTSVPNSWGSLTYNWNFGDGYSSTSASPVHTYAAPGYYNASLFATNAKGCPNSLVRANYIHVLTPAAIGFNAPVTSFCKAPATASFINTTTGAAPITYRWDFGDGNTATGSSPTHVYTVSGSFSVQLIATDGKGCKDTLVYPNYITVGNLTAAFTPVPIGCGATLLTFTNTSSTHVSSQWFFGDGATSASDAGVHSYSLAGTYNVKLIVFDGTCYDTVTHPITISYPAGTISLSPAHPCPPPSALTFTGTVPPGCTVSWIYDDGSTASGPSVTHTYPLARIYSTSMVVTNTATGCRDTISRLDTMFNLNINPSPSPGQGCAPQTDSFMCYAYSFVFDPFTLTTLPFAYPNAITSYSWNFGDGSPPGSGPTPGHTYTTAGVYTVGCTIITANGCTASTTNPVKVGSPQVASFTQSTSHICAGRSISYTDASTNHALIDQWSWNFGDGTSDAAANPVHQFTTPGIYHVKLSVSYNDCVSPDFTRVDTVDSPGAFIGYTYDCIPANAVAFRDSSVGETSHLWIFGDGTTSVANSINHSYPLLTLYYATLATYNSRSGCRDTTSVALNLAKPTFSFIVSDTALCKDQSDTIIATVTGRTAAQIRWYDNGSVIDTGITTIKDTFHVAGMHNVSMVIKDNYGCPDTSATLHILAANPVDSFTLSPSSGCGPVVVNFRDRSTDVAGAALTTYTWNFGDGTAPVAAAGATSYTYNTAGTYTIQETVTDNVGCSSTFTSATHVTVHKPVVSFSVTATTVCAGTAIHFVNTSTGITSLLWFFGDGTTSTVTSPLHNYASSGVYSVSLVVYDAFGCRSDTLTMPGLITVNFSPATSFYMSDSFAVCAPLNVNFFNTTTGAASYTWYFGDSTSSLSTAPSNVYIASGLYRVRLVATASNGCKDTATHNVSIFGYPGAFSYTPLSGCSPLLVHFTSTATGVYSFQWDFADGSTIAGGSSDTLSHMYHYSGDFVPTLILRDSFGCTSASVGLDTIKADTVVAQFTFTPATGCVNAPITFHDASTSGVGFPMTRWLWSFGSGATSTLSAPAYTYTTPGTKTVTLVVTDASGCSSTITHTVTVNTGPTAISGPSVICQGVPASFTDGFSGGTWSGSDPAVINVAAGTGSVTGIGTGTATVSYTSPSGCTATKSVTVAVSPAPIAGVTAMCIATSSPFTDSTPGGIWSIAPLTVATISPTGVVYGVSPGIAGLSYTIGSCAAVKTITISATPSAITGQPSVCVGSTSLYTDSVGGGRWSSSSSHVSVTTGGLVTGVSAGTAIITYSLGSGCTRTRTITVNPSSPIVGASGVCVGGIIGLTDSLSPGTWTSSPAAIATVGSTTGIVTGVSAGTATIYYTLASTGCTVSHIVTVNSPPTTILGTPHVCQYATDTLSDAIGGGVWSATPLTTGTIDALSGILYGVAPGLVTISYSLGSTGCTSNTTVNVIGAPAAVTPVAAQVCPGNTITLHDVTTPGTWSTSSSLATVGSATGIVTGMAAGTATVTYTASATGCYRTGVVTVNALPSAIAGPPTVCRGVSVALTDTMAGCSWSSGNPAIASVVASTGVVTGNSLGVFIITCTNPLTGCQATKTMTVNSAPLHITGPAHVCVGTSISLADSTAGGVWLSGDTSIATIGGTGVVHGVTTGTAVITYSLGIGCIAADTITVFSYPGAITGPTHVCTGSSISLADVPSGGLWNSSNPFIAAPDSAGNVRGISAGVATITYSLGAGCYAVKPVTVNPGPSGITGAPYLCLGLYETLTSATSGGTWGSTPAAVAPVSGSGVIFGADTGLAVISYTISNGCSATLTVSVVSVPPITFTSLTNNCAWGDTVDVNDTYPGGIYTSRLVTVANLGAGNGKVTTHAPGIATVTYTLSIGCSTTSTIIVHPLPDVISGSDHVCLGLPVTLSSGPAGGTWSSPGYSTIETIGATTGIVTGIAAGTGVVTYTLPTGCFRDTMVTIGAMPSAIGGPVSLCQGIAYTLTNTVPGGVWMSSNIAVAPIAPATGVIIAATPGTDTITYTEGGFCTVTTVVTVSALPVPFFVAGGGSYCFGGSGIPILLSGSQLGVRYELHNGSTPVDTPHAGTGGVIDFGTQPGVGAYTVIATNAAGCTAAMTGAALINIYPLPVSYAVTGGGSYCAGAAGAHVGLANSAPGVNYRVYHSGRPYSIPVAGTGTALDFGLFTAPGFYKVFAINTITGCTAYMNDSVQIIITPTVAPSVSFTLSPGDTVCAGTPVTFTASPVNGGSSPIYQWKVNGTGGATGPVFAYTPANNDAVSVLLTSSAPCPLPDTVSRSVAVSVEALLLPVVTITAIPGTTIAHGQHVTLIAGVAGGGATPTYQWYVNGVPVTGATTDSFSANNFANGDSVTCVVTSNGGACAGAAGTHSATITVSTVGIITPGTAGAVTVQPNPNKGTFTISGALSTTMDEEVQLELTDMVGQVVYRSKVVAHAGILNEQVFTNKALANGVYLLSLHADTDNKVFHVVIEQ